MTEHMNTTLGRIGVKGNVPGLLLATALTLGAAARVQAAVNWTGANDNRFSNTANYSSYTYNFAFNNADAARTLVYLDQNYSGKIKFNNDAEKYRGLIFRAHPANAPWHFCGWYGGGIHSYDNSGGTSDQASINIGDVAASSVLRLSAISLTTRTNQVGSADYSFAGHVVMDEYDADGTTWRGPVTFKTTGDMNLYRGDIYATNAVLTCGGTMKLHDFALAIKGGALTAKNIWLGNASGKTSTLTIADATVTNTSGAVYISRTTGAIGTLNLNEGGTLVTRNLFRQDGDTATVVFNGGTLKAKEAYANYGGLLGGAGTMTVTVGEKGATIDNNRLDITIAGNYMQGSGAVKFTGSGSTTLAVAQQYTGGTTIDAGTRLKVNAAAKAALLAHDVTVAIPADGVLDGTLVLEGMDGAAFTQAEVDAMALSGNDGGRYGLALAEAGAQVKVVDIIGGEYVWNRGASGSSWTTAGAWTKNGEPGNWYNLVAAVFETAGDAADVDSDVSAASIAFRAAATVTGLANLSVASVSVDSAVAATISAPTVGALEKTGLGTLTLGAARAAPTTLTEGTLVLAGDGQTTDWSNFAFSTNSAATLALAGGATLAYSNDALRLANRAGENVTLRLDAGGTAEVRNLYHGSGTGLLVFNGGTLKSNKEYASYGGLISSGIAVSITENGGTIDNGGKNILITKDLPGAMTLTGNGTTTIGSDQSATGLLTVNGGTLALNDAVMVSRPMTVVSGVTLKALGAAMLYGELVLEAGAKIDVSGTAALTVSSLSLPASGTMPLTRNGGAFRKGVFPVLGGAGAAALVSRLVPKVPEDAQWEWRTTPDGIVCLSVDTDDTGFVWTGAAGDGRMSTPNNWQDCVVPTTGDALSFAGAADNVTITCDIDATFGDVTMGTGIVTFEGSITATSFNDTSKIAVGKNATVTLDGDFSPAGAVLYSVASGGKFVVTGTLTLSSWGNPQTAPGDGTIVVGRLTAGPKAVMLASCEQHAQKWAIGPEGIVGGAYMWTYSNDKAVPEFRPWMNDFTNSVTSVFRTNAKSFTLNTTGLDGLAHTITLDAGFADNGEPLNVTGTGKVVVNHVTSSITGNNDTVYGAYRGAVQVKGSSTLAINPGKKLTSGAITVNSGAKLEVPQSGAVALGGNLELKSGATLKFTFTERKNAPVLNLTGKTVTYGDPNPQFK